MAIDGGSANSNGEKKKKKGGRAIHFEQMGVSLQLLNKSYFFVESQNSHSRTI
jgi:hypothetical protein